MQNAHACRTVVIMWGKHESGILFKFSHSHTIVFIKTNPNHWLPAKQKFADTVGFLNPYKKTSM